MAYVQTKQRAVGVQNASMKTQVIGEIGFTIVAFAPEVAPVTVSPFVNVPVAPVTVHDGSVTSVESSADMYTARILCTSPLPKEISLW